MAKSLFETKLMRSKVKSSNVKLFPEAFLGYFGGPFFALIPNAIINTYLTQYWKNVLGLDKWAGVFIWLMPLLSTIFIVIGNLVVGRLMERKPKKAGKARPLIFLSIPLIAIALVAIFLAPFPASGVDAGGSLILKNGFVVALTLIITAIGYNLFYAFAWPMYYTSHSAMVNLSTRNSGQRGFLATLVNAAQVGAAGFAGMAGGYITALLSLVPSEADDKYWVNIVKDEGGKIVSYDVDQTALFNARQGANTRWMIVLIILAVLLIVGCLLEYFFTRERITEEKVAELESGEATEVKKVSMAKQMKICLTDKYWWFVIIFFLLYQLGGMLKNNGQPFYSEAWTGTLSMSSTIAIAGAIPTALGMIAIFPIANKFGKANSIKVGAVIAVVCGFIGFIPLFTPWLNGSPSDIGLPINIISIVGFCLKAIGTVPAMYISLALLSDVLDHQEAIHGVRTDGFTMAVYGSIMIAMTGIANAIILGVSSAFSDVLANYRTAMTFVFFGGEVIAYLAIAAMFIFMNVEKYSKFDHLAIEEDQKAKCAKLGVEYISTADRMKIEEEESKKQAEEQRILDLKAKCEKKHLNFEEENAKVLKAREEKEAKDLAAKKAKEEKALAKEQAAKAKFDALSEEKKAMILEKRRIAEEKALAKDEKIKEEFEALRAKAQKERERSLFE